MTTPYITLYIDTVNRNRFVIASDFARFSTIDEMMQEKYGSPCSGARKLLNANGNPKYAKMLRKIGELLDDGEMTMLEVRNLLLNYYGAPGFEIPYIYNEYCDEKIDESAKDKDNVLLESLIKKYGKNGVLSAIKKLNSEIQ